MTPAVATNPRVGSQTFVGIAWGGTALSLIFVVFRIYVRIKSFHRVYADDFLVVLAWLLLLTSAIIWQTQQTAMYTQFGFATGSIEPTPDILAAEKVFLRTEVATIFMFYACLWSVKLSVLIFFRRLGQKVKGQKVWWWCVLGLTVATWATCIGDIQYPCLLRSLEYIFTQCSGPRTISFQWKTLHYNCAVDVITDVMIITIPILMLWNVRISWRKKLALIGLFSLTIIVIIFSIVRVAVVTSHKTQADVTWLYMWSNIEMAVSVIVACLASFRQLFVKSNQPRYEKHGDDESSSRKVLLSRYLRPFASRGSSGGKWSFFSRGKTNHMTAYPPQSSTEHIVPLDNIYVSRDVDTMSHSVKEGTQMPQAHVNNTCYPTKPHGKQAREQSVEQF